MRKMGPKLFLATSAIPSSQWHVTSEGISWTSQAYPTAGTFWVPVSVLMSMLGAHRAHPCGQCSEVTAEE